MSAEVDENIEAINNRSRQDKQESNWKPPAAAATTNTHPRRPKAKVAPRVKNSASSQGLNCKQNNKIFRIKRLIRVLIKVLSVANGEYCCNVLSEPKDPKIIFPDLNSSNGMSNRNHSVAADEARGDRSHTPAAPAASTLSGTRKFLFINSDRA